MTGYEPRLPYYATRYRDAGVTAVYHVAVAAIVATFAGWDPIVVLALIGYGYAACWIERSAEKASPAPSNGV